MNARSELESLRVLQRLLDEAFRVPGTRLRLGWDAILGLVPWAGDLLTAVMSGAILVQAHRWRIPRIVQLRMLANVAADLAIGLVPLVGDVADVFWRANTKNLALLERHADRSVAPAAGDWWFVLGVIAVIVLLAAAPLFVLYWLVGAVRGPELKWW